MFAKYTIAKFKELDPQRHAETWDERWSHIEFPAPLLSADAEFSYRIASPKNHAQRSVLIMLLQPPVDDEIVNKQRALHRKLMGRTREVREAEKLKDIARFNRRQEILANVDLTPGEKRAKQKKRRAEKDAINKALGAKPKPRLRPVFLSELQGELGGNPSG